MTLSIVALYLMLLQLLPKFDESGRFVVVVQSAVVSMYIEHL